MAQYGSYVYEGVVMPFVPALNVAEVTVNMTHDGQVAVNTYHVKGSTTWNLLSITALAQAFVDWWRDDTRTERSTLTCLVNVVARDLTIEGGIAVLVPVGLLPCGTRTSQPMPGNVTLAVKEATGQSGRSNRGLIG